MSAFEELRAAIKQDVTDAMGDRARDHTLMSRLIVYLGGKLKETEPENGLAAIANEWQQAYEARERERFSVFDYFNGRGPVARRMQDAIQVNQTVAGYAISAQMKLLFERAMAPFRIPLIHDLVATQELYHLIHSVSMRVFGQTATLQVPSIPLHLGQILKEHWVSNLHHVAAEDTITRESYSMILLFAEIDGACVCLEIRSTGRAQLMYYHPAEDAWLFSDGGFTLREMSKRLQTEWMQLEVQLADKLPKAKLSVPEMMEALQGKINKVFDNEHLIPAQARHYFRDPQYPVSRIALRIRDLQVNLINTRGQWPSRSFYIIRGIEDVLSTRVQLEELSPLLQKQIVDVLEDVLDGYIEGYIEPKPKEETPDQPFKFQNPVFGTYYGHKGKSE